MSPYLSLISLKLRALLARLGSILRDVLILTLLSALGGFIIGIAVGPNLNAGRALLAAAVAQISLGIVGFTISACLASQSRWGHVAFVAIGVWLVGLNNVVWFGSAVSEWLRSSILIAATMFVGGAISYLFRRNKQADS